MPPRASQRARCRQLRRARPRYSPRWPTIESSCIQGPHHRGPRVRNAVGLTRPRARHRARSVHLRRPPAGCCALAASRSSLSTLVPARLVADRDRVSISAHRARRGSVGRNSRCSMDKKLLAAPAELQSGRIEPPSARATGIAKWQPFVDSLDGAEPLYARDAERADFNMSQLVRTLFADPRGNDLIHRCVPIALRAAYALGCNRIDRSRLRSCPMSSSSACWASAGRAGTAT